MVNPIIARRQIVDIGRRMYERNLIVAGEGNLSVRLTGHCFIVTPSGLSKGDLRVQDLLETGISGAVARGQVTSEWPLHREIYRLRPDIRAICHAHPPWATAFAVAGRDLDGSLLTETADLLPHVPLACRARPGTEEVPGSVSPFVPDHDAILLGSHGAVAMGTDLESAFRLLETVERLAQVTLLAEVVSGSRKIDADYLERLLKRAL